VLEAALESVELVEVAALSCAGCDVEAVELLISVELVDAAPVCADASLAEPTLFASVWLVTGVDWVASVDAAPAAPAPAATALLESELAGAAWSELAMLPVELPALAQLSEIMRTSET
jgi:hypothetical protein